jgi:ApaG protein
MTEAIRITVRPVYLPDRSDPEQRQYVFAYFVRIENIGAVAAKLLWRRWVIHDSGGDDLEVEGEGVVGQQPSIEPSGVHEYQSFVVLKSPEGSMEGSYDFVRPDGSRFKAEIPTFGLDAREAPGPLH